MCITFLYTDHEHDSRYKLVLVNNRDEFFERDTSAAAWEDGILAGRDEKEAKVRGTWLCIDRIGRIANLLDITIPFYDGKEDVTTSRGEIPLQFIKSNDGPTSFCGTLASRSDDYNPFLVLCLQRDKNDEYELCTLANHYVDRVQPESFPPGVYGFSNSPPEKPFKKVQRGVELMREIVDNVKKNDGISGERELIDALLQLASDRHQCYPDEQLKQQWRRSSELCKYRTSIYVQFPDGIRYGTRCQSVILVERNNRATFYERRMTVVPQCVDNAEWAESVFHFDLKQEQEQEQH